MCFWAVSFVKFRANVVICASFASKAFAQALLGQMP